jgi:hypothetical protein
MMDKKSESTLTLTGDLGGFFREVIEETESHTNCAPGPHLKEYVVGLLEDAAQNDGLVAATVDRPLALILSEAMQAAPTERFHRLREAGDGILLVGGLYRTHLKSSGVKDGYIVTLGQRAYATASSLLDVPRGALTVGTDKSFDILQDLALAFSDLMNFLRAVADTMAARAAHSASHLAKLYETWRRDRSAHLASLLRAQGLILNRGSEVTN